MIALLAIPFPPLPIPNPTLCTLLACDTVGGTPGRWISAQFVAAVVLLIGAILLLWIDWESREPHQ